MAILSFIMASTLEQVKFGIWTLKEWKERFSKDEWAAKAPDKNLVKLADRLFEGKDNMTVYFPCCGNSYDMKWAYEQGYEVVGTDCVSEALKDFFDSKAKLPYTEETITALDGVLFKSEDNKIRLYCCDVLNFNRSIEGQCGAIVDSSSIIALNKQDLPKYVDHLVSMMTPNCRLMLFTTEYDENIYPGPPHSLPVSAIRDLFGDCFNYETLHTFDRVATKEFQDWKAEALHFDKKQGNHQGHDCHLHGDSTNIESRGHTKELKTEKVQKVEVLNRMTKLKTMLGRYTLITKKLDISRAPRHENFRPLTAPAGTSSLSLS